MIQMFKSRRFKASLLALIATFVGYYAPSILPAEIVLAINTFLTGCVAYFAVTPSK